MWFSPTLLTGLFDRFAFVNSLRTNVWLNQKIELLKIPVGVIQRFFKQSFIMLMNYSIRQF